MSPILPTGKSLAEGTERKLDELCSAIGETSGASEERAEHRDAAVLRSLHGIGRINLATLLSEASRPLSRRDYQALRTLSGVAPVTKRSGKSHVVVMRYAAHADLNPLRGWAGYFGFSQLHELASLDGWTRRRFVASSGSSGRREADATRNFGASKCLRGRPVRPSSAPRDHGG